MWREVGAGLWYGMRFGMWSIRHGMVVSFGVACGGGHGY